MESNYIGEKGAEALANSEHFKNLKELGLRWNSIGKKGAEALANSEHFKNLKELRLGWNDIGEKGAEALAKSPHLINLEKLDLENNNIGGKGTEALANSEHFKNLEKLRLGWNNIGEKGAEALANSEHFKNLKELSLERNNIGEKGAEALAKSPHLINLEKLDLRRNKIGYEGAKALAKSPHLINLEKLDLRRNKIGYEGAKALAKSPHLINLEKLDLRRNKIGYEGAKALANSEHFKNLKELCLRNNGIGDKGAKVLANSEHFKNLEELDLRRNKIGDEGVKALANSPHLANLKKLNLSSNKIGDEGVKALVNSPCLKNLEELDLCSNKIGDEGVKVLANSPHLANLKELNLSSNKIGGEGIEALALARSRYSTNLYPFVYISDNIFYHFLLQAYSGNQIVDENSVKKMVFEVAQYGQSAIKYILTKPDKYPFLINSQDEGGRTLFHFYTHNPEVQEFLFKYGLIPSKELEGDTELQNILQDGQSVHATPAVEQARFITKKLVESTGINKGQLEQAITSFVDNIPRLLEQYQNNQVKIGLLSLTENEKRSVMAEVLGSNSIPNDKEFIKIVIDKAKQTLEEKYLRKNKDNPYDEGFPSARLQYDDTKDDAKITIPESIGYIKLYIDKLSIPLEERKELLVTLAHQNPELVAKKLFQIRSELGNNDISQVQITDRTEFHKLLNNVDANKVDKLFKEISGLDIEKIWREQKEFALLRQIYVAATTYGKDSSACVQGTWNQIIHSITEISTEILAQYDQHLEEEQKLKTAQKDIITEKNIKPFVKNLAEKLTQYAEDYPEFGDTVLDFAIGNTNINNPKEITSKEQKIFSIINKEFCSTIKEYVPDYSRNIPTKDEYRTIIERFPEIKIMEDFSKDYDNNQVTGQQNPQTEGHSPANSNSSSVNSEPENEQVCSVPSLDASTLVGNKKAEQNYIKTNGRQPTNTCNGSATATENTQKSKWPTVTISVLSVLTISAALVAHFVFQASLLAVGIVACFLVIAAVTYYCNEPSTSLENGNVKPVTNENVFRGY